MSTTSPPTFANGKICYLEIPALDVQQSAAFYHDVFEWSIRADEAGNVSFDDSTGQVSGMWVLGREPAATPGVLISIMVFSIADTLNLIVEKGGQVVQAPDAEMAEITARFADPAGNVFCLYQDQQSIDNQVPY